MVFFTGAGISAESGISTFRDPEGLWSKYDQTVLASPEGFMDNPGRVLSWYAFRRNIIRKSNPNAGHYGISDFQKLFPDSVVITQNVDGLHAVAGNQNIYELHGNIHVHKCHICGEKTEVPIKDELTLNYCYCGGPIRPGVVWFGESLAQSTLMDSFNKVRECDILFTIGTSTQIYPAAQLPYEAQSNGAFVIEINPDETPFSPQANLSLREAAGTAVPKLYEEFYASFS